MTKGKRKGGSKAGRGTASTSSASKNDDSIVDVATQETQPSQEIEETEAKVESPVPAEVEENKEETEEKQEEEKEDAEVGEIKEEAEEKQEDAKPDSATHLEKDQIVSSTDATGASSSQKKSRGRKRQRSSTKKESENKEENKPTSSSRAKRARTTKPQDAQPKRSLEDLWKAAFPVGTEWGQLDALYESNWKFTNVEDALEEGGKLFGKTVYVFGCTESQKITYSNETRTVLFPAVVCIESSIPPSDKIGVASFEGGIEDIIPMKDMKMDWVPYIPLDKRDKMVDRMNFQIYILGCTQRRSALKHLKEDRVKKFNYCLPYIDNPFKGDETEQSTVVQISFTSEPQVDEVACEYDWAANNLEEFTDDLIKAETLLKEQKNEFMEFVQEQIDKSKTACEKTKDVREAREKAKEAMSEETKTAYKEMKFYKFYPLFSPDTPDVANIKKSSFINKYFGEAHEIL